MANEAFALSPISARAALPSEADYDAIREAFMETARGRWFLGEYAKRNRNADTAMVLDAVTRIEATIAAQKPAPANGLQDALVVIRGLLSDAKASAANAMSGPDAEACRAAVNKGTRIVREIAWTLREYGTDARICDMLDAQVTAIDASEQQNITARDAVLATFDLLIRRIGELGGSGAAPPSSDAERAASPASVVDGDAAAASAQAPEAAAEPVEMASEAVAEAVVEAAVATTRDVIGTLPHDAAAPETPVQETQEASAPPSDPTTTAGTTFALEVVPAELPEQNSVAAADAELSAADFETAQDMAVLDVIALEMAEPEIFEPEMPESEVAGPSVAEPAQTSEPEIVEADLAEPNIAELDESDLAKPDIAKPDIVEPDIVEPDIEEFVTVKAGFAGPGAVEPAFATSIAPEPEPQPEVSQPSLGASLIASGIVSGRSSPYDALAPIRRMSQAERIAFFS